jgi:hypothetical protein
MRGLLTPRSTNLVSWRHNPSMYQLSENVVLDALRQIKDPDLHKDIVTLGFIKDLKIDGAKFRFASSSPRLRARSRLKWRPPRANKNLH